MARNTSFRTLSTKKRFSLFGFKLLALSTLVLLGTVLADAVSAPQKVGELDDPFAGMIDVTFTRRGEQEIPAASSSADALPHLAQSNSLADISLHSTERENLFSLEPAKRAGVAKAEGRRSKRAASNLKARQNKALRKSPSTAGISPTTESAAERKRSAGGQRAASGPVSKARRTGAPGQEKPLRSPKKSRSFAVRSKQGELGPASDDEGSTTAFVDDVDDDLRSETDGEILEGIELLDEFLTSKEKKRQGKSKGVGGLLPGEDSDEETEALLPGSSSAESDQFDLSALLPSDEGEDSDDDSGSSLNLPGDIPDASDGIKKDIVDRSRPSASVDADWIGLRKRDEEASRQFSEVLADRREARKDRLVEERKQFRTLDNIYQRATDVSPSFNYLGIGYDVIRGNPVGDPNLMGDPGLRSPIIRFDYAQDEDGVSSDLRELQPRGAYSRAFVACKQSEKLSEIASVSDYARELEADASLSGGDSLGVYSFSASTAYKEVAKKTVQRNTRTFMLKTYCLRYESGLAQTENFNWNYTMAFSDAVKALPTEFQGTNTTEGCTPAKWRENTHDPDCTGTNVRSWMDFIDEFGTHYIVRLFAGGKLTHQITMSKSDISNLTSKGVSVKTAIKAAFGVAAVGASLGMSNNNSQSSQVRDLHNEAETLVMGGRVPSDVSSPDSMAEWSDSVEDLPMPVKITLEPLSNLLPKEKREAFELAYHFYGAAVGMSKTDLVAMGGKTTTIGDALRRGSQVIYAGEPPGFAMCPDGQHIILGFAMHLNFWDTYGIVERATMKPCTSGREKCDGVDMPAKDGDESRIFAVCGTETIGEIEQIVEQSPGKVLGTCPDGMVISVGFSLSIRGGALGAQNSVFLPCRAGLKACSAVGNRGTQRNFVYMACVDERMPGIQNLVNVAAVEKGITSNRRHADGKVSVVCPKTLGSSLGFTLELHTRMGLVRDCFSECPDKAEFCERFGKGVYESRFYQYDDTHSLLAFMTCAELESKEEAAVTHQEGK